MVDDDPDLRRTLAEVLEDEGFSVSCARDGLDALHALEGNPPSVILLDLTMPVMDGWAFRERQRRDVRLAHIPTVVISASFSDPRAVAVLEPDAFLSKPFDVSCLTRTIQRLCERPASAPPPRAPAAPPPATGARAAGVLPQR